MTMYDIWEDKESGVYEPIDGSDETTDSIIDKITSMIGKTSGVSCTWWMLPQKVKDMIKPLTKTKKCWTMPMYKDETNSDWYMDIPMLLTWKETLTGGTEKCLDWWYESLTGEKPSSDSKMTGTLSKYPMECSTTTLTLCGDDDMSKGSSYWVDDTTGMTIWLCPYLPWLMDGIPKKMYLTLETK